MKLLLAIVAIGIVIAGYAVYKTVERPHFRVGEFAGVSLNIELALTPQERTRGLSGRSSLGDNQAMLFVFPVSGRYGFWMKDTLVPLDLYWLDDKGQVMSLFTDVATSSYPTVFKPTAPARYVLETAAGFARRAGVATGTTLHLQSWPTVSR